MHTRTHARLLVASKPKSDVVPLMTFELVYPRFIHPQMRAHRSIAQNVASNRARPTKKLIEQVSADPVPFRWRFRAESGMQPSTKEVPEGTAIAASRLEEVARKVVVETAALLDRMDMAKELVNRLLEPWQWCESVATASLDRWLAFCALRNHEEAQLEIRELAKLIEEECLAVNDKVQITDTHVPYLADTDEERTEIGLLISPLCTSGQTADATTENYSNLYDTYFKLVQYAVSVARCARVSYTPFDNRKRSIAKDLRLFLKLVTAAPPHASPLEHVAFYAPAGSASSLYSNWTSLRHDHAVLARTIQCVKRIMYSPSTF